MDFWTCLYLRHDRSKLRHYIASYLLLSPPFSLISLFSLAFFRLKWKSIKALLVRVSRRPVSRLFIQNLHKDGRLANTFNTLCREEKVFHHFLEVQFIHKWKIFYSPSCHSGSVWGSKHQNKITKLIWSRWKAYFVHMVLTLML